MSGDRTQQPQAAGGPFARDPSLRMTMPSCSLVGPVLHPMLLLRQCRCLNLSVQTPHRSPTSISTTLFGRQKGTQIGKIIRVHSFHLGTSRRRAKTWSRYGIYHSSCRSERKRHTYIDLHIHRSLGDKRTS